MHCKKKTIPGSAGTGFSENSIGQSIQLGLKVVPEAYPHAAKRCTSSLEEDVAERIVPG